MKRRRVARRAGLVLAGAVVPLGWLAMGPAQAATRAPDSGGHSGKAQVADAAEAWYAASPIDTCSSPLGCPPAQAPSSPYPADTLHVGVAGGQETARTYVLPDLLSLPVGATPTGGTMTLPVATDTQAGTTAPDTARIKACVATKPVTDGAQGSTSAPPALDCATSATLKYDAKAVAFTLDLAPFVKAWSSGAVPFGLGFIPAAPGPTDTWHVAFNGKKRAGKHITSLVTYTVAPTPTGSVSGGVAPRPPTSTPGRSVTPPAASSADVSLPPAATQPPSAPAPQVAPQQPQSIAQQPVALSRPFQYPMAFLAPLALLAGAVFFVRLFTRDATPLPVSR